MRAVRNGDDFRLEVDDIRVRICRFIDTKWVTLETDDDDEVRDDLSRLLTCETRRFDYAMNSFFRNYK